MRKKFYILWNSITFGESLKTEVHDFTEETELTDDDILYILSDVCDELSQRGLNALVISKDDMHELCKTYLLSENDVSKES